MEDIKEWVNPFQKKNPRAISGNTIYKILSRYLEYYDMEIQFCDKAGAGERILELLKAAWLAALFLKKRNSFLLRFPIST